MTMNFMRPVAMALCVITAAWLHAQADQTETVEEFSRTVEDEDDGVLYRFGTLELVKTDEPLRELIRQARSNDENAASNPAFAIKTADNKFVMSIGGKIRPVFGFDIGNNLYNQEDAGASFVTGEIPVPALTGHKGDFFISALDSYLDFSMVFFGGTSNQVTGYMKLGTNCVSSQIKLKRAFVTYRGFTVGQAETLLQDADAVQPPTIDPQGPCGDVATTSYQIAYRSPSFSGFRFAVGLEMPSFSSSSGHYLGKDYREFFGKQVDASVDHFVPDIPLWVEYGKGDNRVRLSGILRNFAYQDMVQQKRRNLWGYGVQLSGNFSFWKPLVFNYQAIYGKGIANYIQDLAGRPLSFTPRDDKPGVMEANPMMGLVFGASYNATKKLQFNVVGSYTRIWNVGDYAYVDDTKVADANGHETFSAGDANYRYATYLAVNCFYKFNSFLTWGIEYLYGSRGTYTLGSGHDSRIQTQLQFSF